MDKLELLLKHCKAGVYLTINEHRDYYKSVEETLEELQYLECPPEIDVEVQKKMIKTNTIIDLQFYPDTPIGSYSIYHYDLDVTLDIALKCIT